MTLISMPRLFDFKWFKRAQTQIPAIAPETQAPTPQVEADMRRAYVHEMISADCCVGEYGMQGLMGLFPKDF